MYYSHKKVISLDVSQQTTKQYLDWHHSLDPSFNLMKTLLNQYLNQDVQNYLKKAAKNSISILSNLIKLKYPRNLIRAFLNVIKQNRQELKQCIDMKIIVQNWRNITIDILEFYLQCFEIDIVDQQSKKSQFILEKQIIKKRVSQLIDTKDYDNAIQLIKLLKYPEGQLKELFMKMANSKQASKAANFMKSHNINHKLYPQISERLNKNMIRHFFKNHGWQSVQQIFQDSPEALACIFQDLIFKQKYKEAISIWHRHKQLKSFISKKQTLQYLQKQIQPLSKQYIENNILTNTFFIDYFGPSDRQKYMSLEQYGIYQKNVIWVSDKTCKQMDFFISLFIQSTRIAIDTESIVGKTKLQRVKYQPVSIVQIAMQEYVFILDGATCKSHKLKQAFIKFNKQQKIIMGHALDNDMDGFFLALGFEQNQLKDIKMPKKIDTCKLFKAIYPAQKYSNLAHICLKVLGKEVCKKQTLTNWNRRPLRANQLHYAAMDAFCVLKIYDKLLETVGQNMMSYFIQQGI